MVLLNEAIKEVIGMDEMVNYMEELNLGEHYFIKLLDIDFMEEVVLHFPSFAIIFNILNKLVFETESYPSSNKDLNLINSYFLH